MPATLPIAPHGSCSRCGHWLTRIEGRDRSHRCRWAKSSVGCHWTHPDYPRAVVSTFVHGNPSAGQMKSGYGVWINYQFLGEFATLKLAQQYVETLVKQ